MLHPQIHAFAAALHPREQERLDFRGKAAQRLFMAYKGLPRLVKEWQKRGSEEIIEDCKIVVEWGQNDEEIMIFSKTFIRESQCLKNLPPHAPFIIQQLYSRAIAENKADSPILKTLENALYKYPWAKGSIWLKRINNCSWKHNKILHINIKNDRNLHSAYFEPSGDRIISTDSDTLILWDQAGNPHPLIYDFANATCVRFTPDGRYIIANNINQLQMWNPNTYQKYRDLGEHCNWITALAVSPDSKKLASAGRKAPLKFGTCKKPVN